MAKKKKEKTKLDDNVIITGIALEISEEEFNNLLKTMGNKSEKKTKPRRK